MLEAWVGLRPGRPSVRLEKEVMKFNSNLGNKKTLKVSLELIISMFQWCGNSNNFIILLCSVSTGCPHKLVLFAMYCITLTVTMDGILFRSYDMMCLRVMARYIAILSAL